MAAKPIVEVLHKGKLVTIDFGTIMGRSIRYVIKINNREIRANLFAEEVMRWMAQELGGQK